MDRTHVRFAELVAALSLGIDLGFGQPMEHVLRQCLIALRLADRHGLPEQERVAVYYTALLVNVGCHTDAHEQAKWFGDDIALKAGKYDHELRGVRSALAAAAPRLRPPAAAARPDRGSSSPSPGRREVDDMISHHAEMARALAAELGLPARGDRRARRRVRAVGRQAAGPAAGAASAIPNAARVAQLAEYVEVAHRTGGVEAARELARAARRPPVRPGPCAL